MFCCNPDLCTSQSVGSAANCLTWLPVRCLPGDLHFRRLLLDSPYLCVSIIGMLGSIIDLFPVYLNALLASLNVRSRLRESLRGQQMELAPCLMTLPRVATPQPPHAISHHASKERPASILRLLQSRNFHPSLLSLRLVPFDVATQLEQLERGFAYDQAVGFPPRRSRISWADTVLTSSDDDTDTSRTWTRTQSEQIMYFDYAHSSHPS